MLAIVLITLALIAYSIGIWAEKIAGRLKAWHAAAFTLGLVFDATGTGVMALIRGSGVAFAEDSAGRLNAVMATTGALALTLMAFHACWAVVVLVRNRERELRTFHRVSLAVWTIWLIPYIAGMLAAILS